jgi:hypothetical protein
MDVLNARHFGFAKKCRRENTPKLWSQGGKNLSTLFAITVHDFTSDAFYYSDDKYFTPERDLFYQVNEKRMTSVHKFV